MYPYWNVSGKIQRSGGWLKPEFTQYIDTIIKLARAAHLNTLRPTDYLTDAGQWNDPTVWKNMDYLVSQAGKNHMWVVLDISTYRQWMTNHSQKFLYNAADWAPYVKFITNRYRDSSVICQYSIAGEIKPEVNSGITPTQYVDFYRAVEDQIYSGDGGHHLISVGGLSYLNYKSGLPWQELYSLPHNDIAAIHVYSAGDRNITVPMVSTWAKANHKVFLVEEFGFKQEIGDEKRANSFADIYSWSHQHDAAGIIFWNLGPEVATSSYEVSDQTPLTWAVVQKYAPAQ